MGSKASTIQRPNHRQRTFSQTDEQSTDLDSTSSQIRPRSYSTTVASNGIFVSPRNLGFYAVSGVKCPICSKSVIPEDIEVHLVMCLTRPRINYNEDRLETSKGECVICLEDLNEGDIIARLPCLCIYHLPCIQRWFTVNRVCPLHFESQ